MKWISCLFLVLSLNLHAQNWTAIPAVPSAGRDDAVCFSLNGYGFIVTGYLGTFNESNLLFRYDPVTNSWSEKALFPGIPRQYATVFTLKNKAYLVGGYAESGVALKDVWTYDEFTDNWSQLTDFPGTARWHATALEIRETGYLGMGTTADSTLADFWKYEPGTDSWTRLSDYPGGPNRSVLGFRLLNEGIFGEGFDTSPITYSGSWFAYHPDTDTWREIPGLPAGKRSYGTAVSTGFNALVCGGMDENNVFRNDCYLMDHTKNWKSISTLPENGLRGAKAFTLKGNFYLGTGLNENMERISEFYRLEMPVSTAKESLVFPNPSNSYFNLITEPNAKISVFSVGGLLIQTLKTNDAGFLEIKQLPVGLYICLVEGKNTSEIIKIARL